MANATNLKGPSDWQDTLAKSRTLLHARANRDQVQMKRHTARFVVTTTGTGNNTGNSADGDYYNLGPLLIKGARIHPESCRLRLTPVGGSTPSFTAQLLKGDKTGAPLTPTTPVCTTTAAVTAGATGVFAPASSGDSVTLSESDTLVLNLATGASSVPALTQIIVEVSYDLV